MTQRTIVRIYDRYSDAQAVVNDLEEGGIPHENISLVANADAHGRSAQGADGTDVHPAATGGATGAVIGTVIGGGAGLLAGIGSLAIPGVGPVVAAGWLVATLTGAGVGAAALGLVGSLTTAGVSSDEAKIYAEGVRHGGSLVTVRSDEAEAARIEDIMARHGAGDGQNRLTPYGDGLVAADDGTGASVSGVSPGLDPARRL